MTTLDQILAIAREVIVDYTGDGNDARTTSEPITRIEQLAYWVQNNFGDDHRFREFLEHESWGGTRLKRFQSPAR